MNEIDLLRRWAPNDEVVSGDPERMARARLADAITGLEVAPVGTEPSARRRFAGRALVAGVVTVALAVGGIVVVNRAVDDRVAKIKRVTLPAGTLDASHLHVPMTILLVGSDSRAFVQSPEEVKAFGAPNEQSGQRADTMMLVRVTEHQTLVRSIPRDLLVADAHGGSVQINSLFDHGPQDLITAIRADFGVAVDHYVQIDFRSFIKVVDAVGGVSMFVPARARDSFSGLNLPIAGCRVFDGNQALALVRSRHLEQWDGARWVDASGRSDLDRVARQQRFLSAVAAQAHAAVADHPTRALNLGDAIVRSLVVDSGMSKQLILDLVARFIHDGPEAWSFATVPVAPSPENRNRLVLAAPGTDVFAPVPSWVTVPGISHGPPPLGTAC